MSKIIFVSRLDKDCSLGAYLLCEIAQDLLKKYNDIQIMIIGGGTEYKKISEISQKINKKSNCKLIITTGAVTNPTSFFEKSSLFVGVSRAALEAMAHSLPVILLGNEGYLGLLNEDKLPIAQQSNFTCRNSSKKCDKKILFDEICRYFELEEKQKQHLADLSYHTIKKEYNSKKMAQNTLNIYNKALNHYRKAPIYPQIAICGYYGHGNLGDEAILCNILSKIRAKIPESKIYVLNSKHIIRNLYFLNKSDFFLFGGGSLLQNSTSNLSFFYYIAMIKAAHLLCKKRLMISNGIGPIKCNLFTETMFLNIIKNTLKSFDFISVRDTISQHFLKKLLPDKKIHLFPDPAFIGAEQINHKLTKHVNKKHFVYIPCKKAVLDSKISIKILAKSIENLSKHFSLTPVICVLNTNTDAKFSQKLTTLISGAKIIYPRSPKSISQSIKNAKFVISQRYHGSLFACKCNTPILSVSSDPKLHGLCKDLMLFPTQCINILINSNTLTTNISNLLEYHSKYEKIIYENLKSKTNLSNAIFENILKYFSEFS